MNLYLSRDEYTGDILFEWIAPNFRVGMSVSEDPKESTWYIITKDDEIDGDCGNVETPQRLYDALEEWRCSSIRGFVDRVNRRAEENMARTGKLEGSHYLAMMKELEEL